MLQFNDGEAIYQKHTVLCSAYIYFGCTTVVQTKCTTVCIVSILSNYNRSVKCNKNVIECNKKLTLKTNFYYRRIH